MRARSLGKTDLMLSEVALGTWGLATGAYGPVEPAEFERTVGAALEEGITTFDMAPLWGDGQSESTVRRVARDRRDEVVYITRAGSHLEDNVRVQRFDPKSLVEDCEGSLKRLATDRIDLWFLHNPPTEIIDQHAFLSVVGQLKKEGKIRAWGISVGSVEEARAAIAAGAEAICLVHNLLYSAQLDELRSEIETAQCGVLARSPLMYGLLCGDWSESHDFRPRDHRTARWAPPAFRQRVRQVDALRFLIDDQTPSLLAAAIRFVLMEGVVSSIVAGARSPKHVRQLVASATCEPPYFTDAQRTQLEQVLAAVGA